MRKIVRVLVLGTCTAVLVAVTAYAADQTILGKSFSVKAKPGDPTKTKVSSSASEKNSPNTLVGDPTAAGSAGGAILDIFVNGGNSASQTFVLSQGTDSKGKPFWSGDAIKGFKYKDSQGAQGAVKSLTIKLSSRGQFSIKASVSGKNGPVSILPPNPGTDACVALQLGVDGSGDRYSMQFGPESKITNKGDTSFKATKPVNEGVCPGGPPPTTTSSTTPTSSSSTTTTAPTTTTTSTTVLTTTTTSSTTTTTLYGSPSRAFLERAVDLLD
jgi:hypothetical protein